MIIIPHQTTSNPKAPETFNIVGGLLGLLEKVARFVGIPKVHHQEENMRTGFDDSRVAGRFSCAGVDSCGQKKLRVAKSATYGIWKPQEKQERKSRPNTRQIRRESSSSNSTCREFGGGDEIYYGQYPFPEGKKKVVHGQTDESDGDDSSVAEAEVERVGVEMKRMRKSIDNFKATTAALKHNGSVGLAVLLTVFIGMFLMSLCLSSGNSLLFDKQSKEEFLNFLTHRTEWITESKIGRFFNLISIPIRINLFYEEKRQQ